MQLDNKSNIILPPGLDPSLKWQRFSVNVDASGPFTSPPTSATRFAVINCQIQIRFIAITHVRLVTRLYYTLGGIISLFPAWATEATIDFAQIGVPAQPPNIFQDPPGLAPRPYFRLKEGENFFPTPYVIQVNDPGGELRFTAKYLANLPYLIDSNDNFVIPAVTNPIADVEVEIAGYVCVQNDR